MRLAATRSRGARSGVTLRFAISHTEVRDMRTAQLFSIATITVAVISAYSPAEAWVRTYGRGGPYVGLGTQGMIDDTTMPIARLASLTVCSESRFPRTAVVTRSSLPRPIQTPRSKPQSFFIAASS